MKKSFPFIILVVVFIVGVGLVITKVKMSPSPLISTEIVPTTTTSQFIQEVLPTVTSPPVISQNALPLTVISPADGATVMSSAVTVKGISAAKAQVAVNDVETMADANGNFSVNITIDEGENILYILVNDAAGNVTEKEMTVIYNSGQ